MVYFASWGESGRSEEKGQENNPESPGPRIHPDIPRIKHPVREKPLEEFIGHSHQKTARKAQPVAPRAFHAMSEKAKKKKNQCPIFDEVDSFNRSFKTRHGQKENPEDQEKTEDSKRPFGKAAEAEDKKEGTEEIRAVGGP